MKKTEKPTKSTIPKDVVSLKKPVKLNKVVDKAKKLHVPNKHEKGEADSHIKIKRQKNSSNEEQCNGKESQNMRDQPKHTAKSSSVNDLGKLDKNQKEKESRASVGHTEEVTKPVNQLSSPPSVCKIVASSANVKELPKYTDDSSEIDADRADGTIAVSPVNTCACQKRNDSSLSSCSCGKDRNRSGNVLSNKQMDKKAACENIPEKLCLATGNSGDKENLTQYDRTFELFQQSQKKNYSESEDDLPSMSTALNSFLRQHKKVNEEKESQERDERKGVDVGHSCISSEQHSSSSVSKDSCISCNTSQTMAKDSPGSCTFEEGVLKEISMTVTNPISSTPNVTKTKPRVGMISGSGAVEDESIQMAQIEALASSAISLETIQKLCPKDHAKDWKVTSFTCSVEILSATSC